MSRPRKSISVKSMVKPKLRKLIPEKSSKTHLQNWFPQFCQTFQPLFLSDIIITYYHSHSIQFFLATQLGGQSETFLLVTVRHRTWPAVQSMCVTTYMLVNLVLWSRVPNTGRGHLLILENSPLDLIWTSPFINFWEIFKSITQKREHSIST